MICNNILEYYKYLGEQDKKNKVKRRVIYGAKKGLVTQCQKSYDQGYKGSKK